MTHALSTVLVLDCETRAALAVVRALGKAGYSVTVASECPNALAAVSRFCSVRLACPSAEKEPESWMEWLTHTLRRKPYNWLLPVTDLSLELVFRQESLIRTLTQLPTIDAATFLKVQNKATLLQQAKDLGVRIPRTLVIPRSDEEALSTEEEDSIKAFCFPAVMKPISSLSASEHGFVRGDVAYVDSATEVFSFLRDGRTQIPYLLQERIAGTGIGVFAFCRDGEMLSTFCHKRILEKPPSGGRSVLSESIAPQEAPIEASARLLSELRWNGIAMVEFKRNQRGEDFLMEINPRFWGSLQLAIDSGRNFPTLLLEHFFAPLSQARSGCCETKPYEIGRRLRWELGCVDHAIIRFKLSPFRSIGDVFLRNALELFSTTRPCSWEVLRADDPKPFVAELWQYMPLRK